MSDKWPIFYRRYALLSWHPMKAVDPLLAADFSPAKCLSAELCLPDAGTHFYRMGLSLFPVEGVTRTKARHPAFIFTIELYYWIRSILVLLLPEQSLLVYRLVGDFGFVFGTRAHFALTCIFSIALALNTHLLNWYIFFRRIPPTHLKLFDVMAGRETPQSVGLCDQIVVVSLVRKARVLFMLGEYVPLSLGSAIVFINMFSFYSNSTVKQLVLIVLPNAIGWFVVVNIVYSIIIWNLIYFQLITFYIKTKLKAINHILKEFTRGRDQRPVSFSRLSADLNAIYAEIAECDRNYFSKFLSFVWMTCATILSTLSFFIIFGEMALIVRIFCLYFDLFFVAMLMLVVNQCATVFSEVNKSYQHLNSAMTLWNRQQVSKGLKLMILIERIGEKKIGFHCWKLFIINGFRGYEIISMCAIAFLKVTEMSLYDKEL